MGSHMSNESFLADRLAKEIAHDELDRLRKRVEVLERYLGRFTGADEKLHVAVGGNPIYVGRFLAEVAAVLSGEK